MTAAELDRIERQVGRVAQNNQNMRTWLERMIREADETDKQLAHVQQLLREVRAGATA